MTTTAISVEKVGARFIAGATYEQREIPKAAGFRWDRAKKHWYTTDPEVAAKLNDADAIMAEVAAKKVEAATAIQASRASDSIADLPVPDGLAYLPYQRAGIATAVTRPNILFGDEMGLGKTIQAIGVINADPTIQRVLVICPASLRLNWAREMRKWLVREMPSAIASGSFWPSGFPITIINYDILSKHLERLQSTAWDLVIVDEAHYLKGKSTKRSQAVFGIDDYTAKRAKCEPTPGITGRRKVALTGTPIPNRPIEGFGLFHWLAPAEFKSFFAYATQFCDGKNNGYGWDFSGSSNLPKLQDKLRSTIMVRRLKADVLTELPAKRRAIVEFPANGAAGSAKAEMDAWEKSEEDVERLRVAVELAKAGELSEYGLAVETLRQATLSAFTEMSQLRHDTALATVPYAVDHILGALSEGGQKIVVMAWHRDVVKAIMDAVAAEGIGAVSLTGDTPMQARQDAVDRFQTDPACRVFVGNIQAAGVGITLTAAAHVVFVEMDWVPGNMTQAEDRCHRIGQRDSVLVQHLVLEGSLSARMAKVLIDKQDVIDRALDRRTFEVGVDHVHTTVQSETGPVTPARDRAATEGVSRDKLQEIADKLQPSQIAAIHTGLKMLAGLDGDYAREQNGIGFSRIDVAIGHSLAERYSLTPRQAALGQKLVNKYRRQLPVEVVEGSGCAVSA